MKGTEIDVMLRGLKSYGGVLAFDQLWHVEPGKMYVINNKPSRHPGEHWIVLDWTRRRPYMFDSFGYPPRLYGLPPMQHWRRALQHPKADTCGIYCIYYIVHRSKHYSPERMFESYTRNKIRNDKHITSWLERRVRTLSWKGATS